jgi:hypothetical protein
MTSYKEKYLKYKSKYLNLKNIIGGADEIFTIYTTGTAGIPLDFWMAENGILDNTLRLIPDRYNKIIINHTEINSTFSINKLIDSDIKRSCNTRTVTSTFTQVAFDFSTIQEDKSYLIYDFAHLFKYIDENRVGRCGVYTEKDMEKINEILNLVSIYFGGGGSTKWGPKMSILIRYIVQKTNFFSVESDGSVITFVNTIITRLKNKFNELKARSALYEENPLEILINIGNNIRVSEDYQLNSEDIKLSTYNKIFSNEENPYNDLPNIDKIRISIMIQIFNLCMEGKSYDEIIVILSNKYNLLIKNNSIILPESCKI